MKNFVMILLAMIFLSNQVDAAKIDHYREILLSGRYSIKYENITPLPRQTNKDKIDIFGKSGLAVETTDYFTNRSVSGILIADGEDHRYQEVGRSDFNQCILTQGDETFIFTKYKNKKGDGFDYFGSRKGRVEANSRNYLAELIAGVSYGDATFSRVLNAILPDEAKSSDMPQYEFVTSGTLEDGRTFEDFKIKSSGSMDSDGKIFSAIRYYFNGDTLEKIAYASYTIDSNGKASGEKFIAKISEFSETPDQSLLKLPDGLKDVTKRDKEK